MADLIGPHNGKEFALMKHGLKRCAIISARERPMFQLHGFDCISFRYGATHNSPIPTRPVNGIVAYTPGNYKRAMLLVRELQRPYRDHAKIGLLLDYPKEAIRAFIKKQGWRYSDGHGKIAVNG